jgi:hypothetical protein
VTLILGAQTPFNRYLIAVTLPQYRPSILIWVIAALLLALMGLGIDLVLFPAGPVGSVALWPAVAAAGIVLGLAALEVRSLCADLL